jgi:hypothetical protein
MPLAPGRFSTMICWPRRSVILGPIRRDMISIVLPGGNGTMILTGLAGYACPEPVEAACPGLCAGTAPANVKAITPIPRVCSLDRFMALLLGGALRTFYERPPLPSFLSKRDPISTRLDLYQTHPGAPL